EQRGVRLLHPDVAFAHPLSLADAGAVHRSIDTTAEGLADDGRVWRRTFGPLAARADAIVPAVLAPLRGLPAHPVRAARYAPIALRSAAGVAGRFRGDTARALVAGVSAHAMLPLDKLPTGAFGALLTTLAH